MTLEDRRCSLCEKVVKCELCDEDGEFVVRRSEKIYHINSFSEFGILKIEIFEDQHKHYCLSHIRSEYPEHDKKL